MTNKKEALQNINGACSYLRFLNLHDVIETILIGNESELLKIRKIVAKCKSIKESFKKEIENLDDKDIDSFLGKLNPHPDMAKSFELDGEIHMESSNETL